MPLEGNNIDESLLPDSSPRIKAAKQPPATAPAAADTV